MPAYNAGAPRSTATDPTTAPVANPGATGAGVIMDPFSGPKGSPKDTDSSNNASTGALSTGIGYGPNTKVPGIGSAGLFSASSVPPTYGFVDDSTPGVTKPDGTAATTAILLAIGGGKSAITPGTGSDYSKGTSAPSPYAVQPLLAFGNGGLRDAGAGPAYTGFGMKVVTASGAVANGAAIETGFTNRSGVAMTTGNSQFGINATASAAVT